MLEGGGGLPDGLPLPREKRTEKQLGFGNTQVAVPTDEALPGGVGGPGAVERWEQLWGERR